MSVAVGVTCLILKLLYGDTFLPCIAPLVGGMFFLFGTLFLFIGLLVENVASIHSCLERRPVFIEQERLNFDAAD